MDLAAIILATPLPIGNIRARICDERLEYPPEVRARVDEIWHRKVAESKAAGSGLWDGENYHLLGYDLNDDLLTLRIGLAKYRDVAFRLYPEELVGDMHAARGDAPGIGLFVAGLVETSDGYFAFGRRSSAYLRRAGKVALLGGVLQPDDARVSGADDLYAGLVRELAEEAGMRREHLSGEYLAGMVRSAHGNTGLIFRVQLDRTREEAMRDFADDNDGEMETLEFMESGLAAGELRRLAERDPTMNLYARLLG